MTTEAPAASATVVTPDAGIVAATTGAADQGSNNAAAADPFSGLVDPGIREWVGKAGIKDVASLAVKARDAESLIGRSIQLPGADAKPEDWDKVYARLGRPDKADAYEFKLPDGIPENFNYDAERAKAFKSVAHKAGLTPKQAAIIHDEETRANAAAFAKLQETVASSATAATQALEKAWGGPKDSEPYKQGMAMAGRALAELDKLPGVSGIQKALEGAGVLMPDGQGGSIVMEPTIAIMLSEITKRLFKEDSLVTGGSSTADTNPFADATANQTLQMQMVAHDKEKARRLILAANKQPADWGIT